MSLVISTSWGVKLFFRALVKGGFSILRVSKSAHLHAVLDSLSHPAAASTHLTRLACRFSPQSTCADTATECYMCSNGQLKARDEASDLYGSSSYYSPLTTDWTASKAAVEDASNDVVYGLQTGSIGIGEPAPNFSGDAVIDNEITECASAPLSSTAQAQYS